MKEHFISVESRAYDAKNPPCASYVRRDFSVREGLLKATLGMTALGAYIPYINGAVITKLRLLPGSTDYNFRLQYQTFDITEHLKPGANAIGVTVGEGWFRGPVGPFSKRAVFGDRLALAGKISLSYADGSTEEIFTDESWKFSQDGPLMQNDLKDLERYDARKEGAFEGWAKPGFDDASWQACGKAEYKGELIPDEGALCYSHEAFTPEVLHTPDGRTVLDFGQNMAGHISFAVTGSAGQKAALQFGETLDKDGNFTLKNLGSPAGIGQRMEYILKDGRQEYEARFFISGFRYALLVEWPCEALPEDFYAFADYSDIPERGSFECSEPLISKIHENVKWSQKSNFVDIPTDCPQRERAGWTGDINVFIETANYLTDNRGIIGKWLHDLEISQLPEGGIPFIVPPVPMGMNAHSSAGWGDAIVNVPMVMYEFYGDKKALEEAWPAARRWVEFNIKRAEKKAFRHTFKRGEDFRYVLDTGFHFGEWLEPGASNLGDAAKAFLSPDAEVATAWHFYSTKRLAEMAEILGFFDEAAKYKDMAEKIRLAYIKYFTKDGRIASKRQCKYVRPLYMGILEGDAKKQAADDLAAMVRAGGGKIGTGFLTTYQILNVLTDNGHADEAYMMLENEACPGWLYEVGKGATTIWEGWDAVGEDGSLKAKSLNHYSPGAAMSWLYSRLCGIRPLAPGFTKVLLKPAPGGSLKWAKASFESVSGKISASWSVEDGHFTYDIEIPEGVEARVEMPDGAVVGNAASGRYECEI